MKFIKILYISFFWTLFFIHCKNENKPNIHNQLLPTLLLYFNYTNESNRLPTSPEASAAFDNQAKGIYRGVFTGSSGSFKVNYDNKGKGEAPVLEYNYINTAGKKVTKKIKGTVTIASGVHTLSFKDTFFGGTFTASFSFSSSGNINSSTLNYGANSFPSVSFKERSTSLVRGFEGTFKGSLAGFLGGGEDSGIWNFVTDGTSSVSLISKTLVSNGTSCISNCETTFVSIDLDSNKKITVVSPVIPTVIGTGNCSVQTTGISNEVVELSRSLMTGTYSAKIVNASCTVAPGQNNTIPIGTEIVGGTFVGRRTR